MNNLTAREKGFMYVITLLIIVVLGYFFGIRTLNKKYDEYKTELQTLQERKAYLDQLRENNASMASEIELLKASCSELELSFIDEIETECLEQYVLKTFETEGCPYLVSVSSADLGMSAVEYPDGTVSPDGLVCMQISVTYASTDGYTVTQYNRTPDFTNPNTVAQTITELEEQMGQTLIERITVAMKNLPAKPSKDDITAFVLNVFQQTQKGNGGMKQIGSGE